MLQEMIPTLPISTLLNTFRVRTLPLPCLHLSMPLKYIPFLKEILNMHQAPLNLTVQVLQAVQEIHIWAGDRCHVHKKKNPVITCLVPRNQEKCKCE